MNKDMFYSIANVSVQLVLTIGSSYVIFSIFELNILLQILVFFLLFVPCSYFEVHFISGYINTSLYKILGNSDYKILSDSGKTRISVHGLRKMLFLPAIIFFAIPLLSLTEFIRFGRDFFDLDMIISVFVLTLGATIVSYLIYGISTIYMEQSGIWVNDQFIPWFSIRKILLTDGGQNGVRFHIRFVVNGTEYKRSQFIDLDHDPMDIVEFIEEYSNIAPKVDSYVRSITRGCSYILMLIFTPNEPHID